MIKITFPNGDIKEFNNPITGLDIAKGISTSLAKNALFIKFNDNYIDLTREITTDGTIQILTSKDSEILPLLRHSAAHIMAQAIKELYPNVKFAIGPSIENGFYYDIE